MPVLVRILGRWLAVVRDGTWTVVEGPAELATGLAATRPDGFEGDDRRLVQHARVLYPDLEVLDGSQPLAIRMVNPLPYKPNPINSSAGPRVRWTHERTADGQTGQEQGEDEQGD